MRSTSCVGIVGIFVLLFSFSSLAADQSPIEIEGVIGDFAAKARTYVIGGQYYRFEKEIFIENQSGERLTFEDLRGGVSVRLIGVRDLDDVIHFQKIVVITR